MDFVKDGKTDIIQTTPGGERDFSYKLSSNPLKQKVGSFLKWREMIKEKHRGMLGERRSVSVIGPPVSAEGRC